DDVRSGVAGTSSAAEAAFDDDFDEALASSLEDVSLFEDDLPVDDGLGNDELGNDGLGNDRLAASLEQDFRLDDDTADETAHAVVAADLGSGVA
ncbi:hypothetical protein, partial [Mesorhizobium sp.]|uniref:hypothetical protein n=1 Tax=Mesorhizobium sp. TaxID=1871066 RepID=UPI0025803262